jgi:ankyrin repeat protein
LGVFKGIYEQKFNERATRRRLRTRVRAMTTLPSRTALFDAAKRWDFGKVKSALSAVPSLVKARDPRGRMAIHVACAAKAGAEQCEPHGIKTVTALLKAGTPLEAEVPMDEDEGDFRATPIWYAYSRGENPALVRFLIGQGADTSYSLWAAVRDDDVMCRKFLAAKPRLNLRAHGETPIFYAARLKRLKTLKLLIAAGADPRIKDPRGRDALDIARARHLPADMIERLAALMQRMG